MRGTWENYEKLRSDIFKLIGITLCTPFCALMLNLLVNGWNFSGDFTSRLIVSLWLFKESEKYFSEALNISFKLDKRINSNARNINGTNTSR